LPRLRPSLGLIPEAAPWPTRAQREERLFEDSSRSLEFAAPTLPEVEQIRRLEPEAF